MLKLYYKIWVAAITRIRSVPYSKDNWKFVTMGDMSLLQSFNLLTIYMVLYSLGLKFTIIENIINIHFLDFAPIEDLIKFFIFVYLPLLIMNHVLIFRNNRYEYLIAKYAPQRIQIFAYYYIFTFVVFLCPIIIRQLFLK